MSHFPRYRSSPSSTLSISTSQRQANVFFFGGARASVVCMARVVSLPAAQKIFFKAGLSLRNRTSVKLRHLQERVQVRPFWMRFRVFSHDFCVCPTFSAFLAYPNGSTRQYRPKISLKNILLSGGLDSKRPGRVPDIKSCSSYGPCVKVWQPTDPLTRITATSLLPTGLYV